MSAGHQGKGSLDNHRRRSTGSKDGQSGGGVQDRLWWIEGQSGEKAVAVGRGDKSRSCHLRLLRLKLYLPLRLLWKMNGKEIWWN